MPCPAGTFSSETGNKHQDNCTTCSPGYYCKGRKRWPKTCWKDTNHWLGSCQMFVGPYVRFSIKATKSTPILWGLSNSFAKWSRAFTSWGKMRTANGNDSSLSQLFWQPILHCHHSVHFVNFWNYAAVFFQSQSCLKVVKNVVYFIGLLIYHLCLFIYLAQLKVLCSLHCVPLDTTVLQDWL